MVASGAAEAKLGLSPTSAAALTEHSEMAALQPNRNAHIRCGDGLATHHLTFLGCEASASCMRLFGLPAYGW